MGCGRDSDVHSRFETTCKSGYELWLSCLQLAAVVSAAVATSAAAFAWLCWRGQLDLAAWQPRVVYLALLALLLLPMDIAHQVRACDRILSAEKGGRFHLGRASLHQKRLRVAPLPGPVH